MKGRSKGIEDCKKVLILGIDALEYDLVEQWDLKNLKQKEYGKTELPLVPGQEPVTVIIWPCFITGCMPKEMGYSTLHVFPQPLQHVVDTVFPFFRRFLIDYEAEDRAEKKKGKQGFLDKIAGRIDSLGLSHKPTRRDIRASTVFDNPNFRSVHLHVPVYDDDAFPEHRGKTIDAVSDKMVRSVIELNHKQEFNHRTKEVFDWIEKDDWDLFMQYFFLLDGVQHVFYNNVKKIAKFYVMFDEFVGKVKQKIDDDTLLLIVSDHGQKKGIHTDHGFYSVNKPLGLKNPKLIDFKWIIEDILE
ncbi:MAG: alkaline phosphatase family protein [Petrotogales bacterium]